MKGLVTIPDFACNRSKLAPNANSSHENISNGPANSQAPMLEAMNKLLASFRLRAHIPALVLLLAILAPVFIAVLPAPAMSAQQQLFADIASSLCVEHGRQQQQDNQNLPADHHQCCILCAAQSHGLAPADATLMITSALKRLQQPVQQAALLIILKRTPPLEWASPRGPPAPLST